MSVRAVTWSGLSALMGGFLVQLTLGSFYSFGNMMTYMTSYMRREVDKTMTYANFVIVQSAWGMTQGCIFPLAGLFIKRFGEHGSLFLGVTLFAAGVALTTYTIDISLAAVAFSYGIVAAFGQGISLIPTMTIGMRWFPQHRGKAMGVIVGGFGGGALLFIQIQTLLINPTNLPLDSSSGNGTADAFRNSGERYFTQTELLDRVPGALVILAVIYLVISLLGCIFLIGPSYYCRPTQKVTSSSTSATTAIEAHTPTDLDQLNEEVEHLKMNDKRAVDHMERHLSVVDAVGTVEFLLLWATRFLVVAISQTVAAFYKAYGQTLIPDDDHFLSIVGSASAVCNCFGRLLYGSIMDYTSYRTAMLIESVLLVCLLSSYSLISLINFPPDDELVKVAFGALTCLIFLSFPGTYATQPAATVQSFGHQNGGAIYGLIFTTDIFNNLLISALARPLVNAGGYESLWLALVALAAMMFVCTTQLPSQLEPDHIRPVGWIRRFLRQTITFCDRWCCTRPNSSMMQN